MAAGMLDDCKAIRREDGNGLNRGMHIEPLSKGMDICGQKVSERKSCLEINNARLGL